MTTLTRLDAKLARIRADPSGCSDFILCDAKDADMAYGIGAPGPDPRRPGRFKTRQAFLDQVRAVIEQDEVDLMLGSVSTMAQMVVAERRFEHKAMATAIRANDATDVWALRHGAYVAQPSRPFRSAHLPAVKAAGITDLGLYSITFNNDIEHDLRSLEAFGAFRRESAQSGFRYFLEVFNPNAPVGLTPQDVPLFVNDCIVRALAGLTGAERPLFLKVAYNGPAALEELVSYDPELPVGVLGGSSGTTLDTFTLLQRAQGHGARLALFGRKINLAEDPVGLIGLMRRVVQRDVSPEEAVHIYHAGLANQHLRPHRTLADDLLISEATLVD